MSKLNFQTQLYDVIIEYQDSYEKGHDDANYVQSILKRFLDLESDVTTYDIDQLAQKREIFIGVEVEGTNKYTKYGDEKWPKGSMHPVNWHRGCSIPLRKMKYTLEHPDRECFWIKMNFEATQSLILDFDRIELAVENGKVEYIIGDCSAYDNHKECYTKCWRGNNPAFQFEEGYRRGSKCAMMIMLPWNDARLGKYSCDNGFREWATYINSFCFSKLGYAFQEPFPELLAFYTETSQTSQMFLFEGGGHGIR